MSELTTVLLSKAERMQNVADELRDAAASAESEALAAWKAYDDAVADVETAATPSLGGIPIRYTPDS